MCKKKLLESGNIHINEMQRNIVLDCKNSQVHISYLREHLWSCGHIQIRIELHQFRNKIAKTIKSERKVVYTLKICAINMAISYIDWSKWSNNIPSNGSRQG